MQVIKGFIYLLILSILLSSCRVYSTRLSPDEMDRAMGWNGQVRVVLTDGQKFDFLSIKKDNEGNYLGTKQHWRHGEDEPVERDVKMKTWPIKEVRLEDQKRSKRRTAIVYTAGGVGLLGLVQGWSLMKKEARD